MTLIQNRPSASESAPVSDILVATESAALAERVRTMLQDEHTSVVVARSTGEIDALTSAPDMVVLDAESPAVFSERLLVRLRHRWLTAIVLVVSVPDTLIATTLLDAGADDAIETQQDWQHVASRLNAAARRTRTANALLRRRVGDVVYDRDHRRVWCRGVEVEFAPRELAVLDVLWLHAGELVRHESLQDYVWTDIEDGERSNRLEVYISYIRRKLQHSEEVTIQTLRGAGYRLVRKNAMDMPWTGKEA